MRQEKGLQQQQRKIFVAAAAALHAADFSFNGLNPANHRIREFNRANNLHASAGNIPRA
jgi:hypothetical protein